MDLLSLPRHHPEEMKTRGTHSSGGWASADVGAWASDGCRMARRMTGDGRRATG